MKNLMFQGTASSVGKSLLTAGFLRILSNEGYHVAPFKSQNMSLNSFVTQAGLELGRAQAMQAEAARIAPDAAMNPILMKPTGHMGSQIVIMGKVAGNYSARDYYREKEKWRGVVVDAYESLRKAHDGIVIEGAGSPAEINLRSGDLVNMGFAELVDAPVILIGDIDRGGVFASLYGTVKLLSESDQKRIKGFIINKFRGDVTLLEPGIKMIEEKLGIPCVGVLPHEPFQLDEEDSVTLKTVKKEHPLLKVAVIRTPSMSNFTDFEAFNADKDFELHYIKPSERGEYDLYILPGTKTTLSDYEKMEDDLRKLVEYLKEKKIPLIGICGGYQMLGRKVTDPEGVEGKLKERETLGLIPMETVMRETKRTCLSTFPYKGKTVTGYEIHMGESIYSEPVKELLEGEGYISEDGLVMGTYLHGILEDDVFRNELKKELLKKKGIETCETFSYSELKDSELNRLAEHMKAHLNIDFLKELMGI
ncbi:cobyric acid synthase [Guggenheimella bovis]